MRVVIDWPRVDAVLVPLVLAYREKTYPFSLPDVHPPQIDANLPKTLVRGSRDHALWLFKLCYYMRGGVDSNTAAKLMARLYDEHAPALFDPRRAMELSPPIIAAILRSYGLGINSEQHGRFWVANSAELVKYWKGNPVNVLLDVTDYEVACKRIIRNGDNRGFHGFREKMVSMLIYFLVEGQFLDEHVFPIPVDFHVCRVVIANRLISIEGDQPSSWYIPPILSEIRKLFTEFCRRHGERAVDVCDAVWLLSRTLCFEHPGNYSFIGERHGRSTQVDPKPFVWDGVRTAAYDRSCRGCPIRETCELLIPAAPYYIGGKLAPRGPRTQPPQLSLF